MDADVFLIIGVICLLFSMPAFLSAFSESRPPRLAAILLVLGVGLIAGAVAWTPGGYAPSDIPSVFISVLGRIFN